MLEWKGQALEGMSAMTAQGPEGRPNTAVAGHVQRRQDGNQSSDKKKKE